MTLLYKARASPREHFLLSPKVSLKSKGANMTILIAPACVFNTYGVPGELGKATTSCERSLVDLKNRHSGLTKEEGITSDREALWSWGLWPVLSTSLSFLFHLYGQKQKNAKRKWALLLSCNRYILVSKPCHGMKYSTAPPEINCSSHISQGGTWLLNKI